MAHRSPEGETKMRQKQDVTAASAEKAIRDIRRATRRHRSAEEKIRIVLSGLRGEEEVLSKLGATTEPPNFEDGEKRLRFGPENARITVWLRQDRVFAIWLSDGL